MKHTTLNRKIVIVGNPNVGKSVLFNALSRQYVTVSNYPGTTVEVSRGLGEITGQTCEIVDTPGMYSLFPVTEEERVARRMLITECPELIIHVMDAKNLERMLPLTLQLLDAALPVILVLNMMDEAERAGVSIDASRLAMELGIPVIPAVATKGIGIAELREAIGAYRQREELRIHVELAPLLEQTIRDMTSLLPAGFAPHISRRSIAMFLLGEDEEIDMQLRTIPGYQCEELHARALTAKREFSDPIAYRITLRYREEARGIAEHVISISEKEPEFKERLSRLMMRPLTGFPILLLILYLGLYKFVGGIGAGIAVDFMEGTVFEEHLNPFFSRVFTAVIPWPVISDLLVGDYGVLTLGIRYAVAIILPIVTFFFLVFSIIEDTGYLPRLAMLIDRLFKKIGLSGRAVIPMVLGLGCATMATMVTRTLPTRRERVIATLLLSLAVPCSAQLGVILALLEGRPLALGVWAAAVGLIFLAVGWLAARLFRDAPAFFYMEVPPLRLPQLSNVMNKTFVRVKWYFKEILPLFLLASGLIWAGQLTRLFDFLIWLLQMPVRAVGLPPECAKVFLFGFLRRDYGAAGLYDLNKQHLLSNNQVAVASVALTLFVPCIAQLLMNLKERGWKTGVGISVATLIVSFTAAYLLNIALTGLGIVL